MAPTRVSIPRIRNVRLKENPVGDMLIPMGPGQAVWTPRRYDRFADEGYIQNVIAYRCVRLIADSIAGLEFYVEVGDEPQDNHPLALLFRQPNPADPGPQFLQEVVSQRAIAGNGYIYAARPRPTRPPVELWPMRPDRMKIVPGEHGLPMAWDYEVNGMTRRFPVDPLTGQGDILHLKGFHPLDDWYGLSPIEPAARSIDQDNAATAHNASLLQNGARPSGALVMRESITAEQRLAAEAAMRNWYQNGSKAGLPMVLGGPWEWLNLNLTMQEMEFAKGLDHNARRICAAFNIPHVLVVPGESTYNNRREAREELYEHTVLPEIDMILASLNGWLAPMYGPNVRIRYDPDKIPALAGKRDLIRAGVRSDWRDDLITHGEAREGLGYGIDDEKADQYRSEVTGLGLGMPGGLGDGGDDDDDDDQPPADDATGEDKPKKAGKGRLLTKADEDDIAGAIDDSDMIDLLLPEIRDSVYGFGQFEIDRLGLGVRFDLFNPRVVEFLEQFGAERVTGQITETTKRAIGKTLAEARAAGEGQFQQIKRIQAVFDQATGSRARLIAQTESTRASSFGSLEAMTQVGVELKRWISSRDSRVRGSDPKDKADHVGLDLQTRRVGENFRDPRNGHEFQHPGASTYAVDSCECRCIVIAYDPDEDKGLSVDGVQVKADMVWKQFDAQRLPYVQKLEGAARHAFQLQYQAVLKRLLQVT